MVPLRLPAWLKPPWCTLPCPPHQQLPGQRSASPISWCQLHTARQQLWLRCLCYDICPPSWFAGSWRGSAGHVLCWEAGSQPDEGADQVSGVWVKGRKHVTTGWPHTCLALPNPSLHGVTQGVVVCMCVCEVLVHLIAPCWVLGLLVLCHKVLFPRQTL